MPRNSEIDGPILFAPHDDQNTFDWFGMSDNERADYVYNDLIINELIVADRGYAETYMQARAENISDEQRWLLEIGLRFYIFGLRKKGEMHSEEETLEAAYTMANMIPDNIPGAIKNFVDTLKETNEELTGDF